MINNIILNVFASFPGNIIKLGWKMIHLVRPLHLQRLNPHCSYHFHYFHCRRLNLHFRRCLGLRFHFRLVFPLRLQVRKSTRLNSSHVSISYTVFCFEKKILVIYLLLFSFSLLSFVLFFSLLCPGTLLYLHSFPTRRSSDLLVRPLHLQRLNPHCSYHFHYFHCRRLNLHFRRRLGLRFHFRLVFPLRL